MEIRLLTKENVDYEMQMDLKNYANLVIDIAPYYEEISQEDLTNAILNIYSLKLEV